MTSRAPWRARVAAACAVVTLGAASALAASALAASALTASTIAAPATAARAPVVQAAVFPGASWATIPPESLSAACRAGLDHATELTRALPTTGAMAITGGRVLWAYGDVEKLSYLASVRKSLLAMLYGKYVANGTITLDATLADLGIDDVDGLLPAEKAATVADLLGARSGVYHEAANAACTGCGSTAGDPPGPRGTVPHGTYFLYNNWDFNALGTIFEQRTGQDIYAAFGADIATPIGLEDYRLDAQRKSRRPQVSVHPAYHFYLSTRDMARVGYLMLRDGQWQGRQIVPRDWVRRMTTAVTHVPDMHPDDLTKGPFGYGYL
ncbi:MAG: serine hydrolase, partial [Vicinamibacterales bacterium]